MVPFLKLQSPTNLFGLLFALTGMSQKAGMVLVLQTVEDEDEFNLKRNKSEACLA